MMPTVLLASSSIISYLTAGPQSSSYLPNITFWSGSLTLAPDLYWVAYQVSGTGAVTSGPSVVGTIGIGISEALNSVTPAYGFVLPWSPVSPSGGMYMPTNITSVNISNMVLKTSNTLPGLFFLSGS